MNRDKVTVLLPVYNCESYVDECIKSIRDQTYKNLEILIINDGSNDGSEHIILKHAKQDERIIYIHQPNRGLIETLNYGLDIATGKYIARIDADDVCLPNRIESQYLHMEATKADICGGNYYEINDSGDIIRRRFVPFDRVCMELSLVSRVPFAHPTVMFRNSFLIENNVRYRKNANVYAEDLELWCRLKNLGASFSNTKDFLIKYRVLNTSLSRLNKQKIFFDSMRFTTEYYIKYHEYLLGLLLNEGVAASLNPEEEEIVLSFIYREVLFKHNLSILYLLRKFKFKQAIKSLLRELKHYKYRKVIIGVTSESIL